MEQGYPQYFRIGNRLVQIVSSEEAGLEALVCDESSGLLMIDQSYLRHIEQSAAEVTVISVEEYQRELKELRREISWARQDAPIQWEHTGDGEYPYEAIYGLRLLTIRVNDFPEEPLYTLLIDGKEVEHLDDWPRAWRRPPIPQELLDLLSPDQRSSQPPATSPTNPKSKIQNPKSTQPSNREKRP